MGLVQALVIPKMEIVDEFCLQAVNKYQETNLSTRGFSLLRIWLQTENYFKPEKIYSIDNIFFLQLKRKHAIKLANW